MNTQKVTPAQRAFLFVLSFLVVTAIIAAYIDVAQRDQLDAERVAHMTAAYNAGFRAGLEADLCVGLRFDRRTGEAVR